MSSLGLEVETTLRRLDESTALKFQRLVRDVVDLVTPVFPIEERPSGRIKDREASMEELRALREKFNTGIPGTPIEQIIDDIRS